MSECRCSPPCCRRCRMRSASGGTTRRPWTSHAPTSHTWATCRACKLCSGRWRCTRHGRLNWLRSWDVGNRYVCMNVIVQCPYLISGFPAGFNTRSSLSIGKMRRFWRNFSYIFSRCSVPLIIRYLHIKKNSYMKQASCNKIAFVKLI